MFLIITLPFDVFHSLQLQKTQKSETEERESLCVLLDDGARKDAAGM
jgi:hypothetical protein